MNPKDARGPAATELALLGATHTEVASTVVSDFESRSRTVTIGAGRSLPRNAQLDVVGSATLRVRVTALQRACRRAKRPWSPEVSALALAAL